MDSIELQKHVTPLDEFELSWRFTEAKFNQLPEADLKLIQPLNKEGSRIVSQALIHNKLHFEFPFKKGFFASIQRSKPNFKNPEKTSTWLKNLDVEPHLEILLSWNQNLALITNWKTLAEYWDDFFYAGSDDLSVFGFELTWALLFFHEEEIWFGRN